MSPSCVGMKKDTWRRVEVSTYLVWGDEATVVVARLIAIFSSPIRIPVAFVSFLFRRFTAAVVTMVFA